MGIHPTTKGAKALDTFQYASTPILSQESAASTHTISANDPGLHANESGQSATPLLDPPASNTVDVPASDNRTTETYGTPPGLPPNYGDWMGGGPPRRRRHAWRYVLALVILLAALGGGIAIGYAATAGAGNSNTAIGSHSAPALTVSSSVTSLQQTVENAAKAVEPSVVEITSTASGQEAIGSGDILTSNGYIVTNDHVVDGYTNFTVTLYNGKTYTAQLVGTDPQDDLAVIKISATNLTPISFADSSKVTVGEFAVAIGSPLGQQNTATFGTVSAINRTESEAPSGPASVLTGMIQTSAPIAPGNSGGALVNLQGQLIGMPTLGASSTGSAASTTNIGFAISSNEVKTVAQQLIQNGRVTSTGQGFVGIQGEDVTPQVAAADGLSVQSGVLVAGFANDTAGKSPAQQAGIQTGDVIVAVNGQSIASSSDLATAVLGQKPGTKISVTVVRGSSQLTFNVTLGERPTNG
jgi:S1-C subfamily serine protease